MQCARRGDRDIFRISIDTCKYVRLLVAELVFTDTDNSIPSEILRLCDGIRERCTSFPCRFVIRRRRHCKHDGGGIAVDPIRLYHRDLIETAERLVVRKIPCLPRIFRRIVTVRKDAQRITEFEPQTLRVVFGIELAEPAFLLPDRSDLCPSSRVVRQQV